MKYRMKSTDHIPVEGKTRRTALLVSLLIVMVFSIGWWQAGNQYRARLLEDRQMEIRSHLNTFGNALSSTINRRFALLDGLVAFVQTNLTFGRKITEEEFKVYASGMSANTRGIRNFALAPGCVYRYVYPLEGNEAVPGLDLLHHQNPVIRADVERAIQSRAFTLSGPYDLVQGGVGLVARKAVFRGDSLWGLVAIAVDMPPLLREAGFGESSELTVAIRSHNGVMVFGSASTFDLDPMINRVVLPEASWQVACLPASGWSSVSDQSLRFFNVIGLTIGLLVGVLVYFSLRRRADLIAMVSKRTKQLRESEEEYRRIIETANEGVWMLDAHHKTMFVNARMAEMLGYSREEMAGADFAEFLPEADSTLLKDVVAKSHQGAREVLELRLRRKDGNDLWALAGISILASENETSSGVLAMVMDISARKLVEESLSREYAFRQAVEDSVLSGIVVAETSGRITHANRAFFAMTGWSKEDIVGTVPPFVVWPPEELTSNRRIYEQMLNGEMPADGIELRFMRRDGKRIDVLVLSSPLSDAKGNVTGWVSSITDITDRKEMERELRRQESLLRNVIETLPVGLWIVDKSGKMSESNPAARDIWAGALYVGIDGLSEYKGWWAESGKRIEPDEWASSRAVKKGESSLNEEINIESFDGSHKTILNSAVPIRSLKGEILGAIVVNQDITERKQSERRIARLNRVFSVLSNINEMIVRVQDKQELFDEVCRIICETGSFRAAWIGLVDASSDEIAVVAQSGVLERDVANILAAPMEMGRVPGPMARMAQGERYIICNNVEHDAAMAPWKNIARANAFRSSGAFAITMFGRVVGALHLYADEVGYFDEQEIKLLADLSADISFALEFMERGIQRQQAEESLRASELRMRRITENMLDTISQVDEEFAFQYVTPSIQKLVGYKPEELVGKKGEAFIHPDDLSRAKKQLSESMSRQNVARIEYRFRHAEGHYIWVESVINTLPDEDNHRMGYIFVSRDITSRKEAETLLRESEAALAEAEALAHVGNYRYSFDGTPDAWSRETYLILGLDPSLPSPSSDEYRKFVHCDDVEYIWNETQRCVLAKEPFDLEYRVVRPNGEIRFVHSIGRPVLNEAGTVTGVFGTIMDVTDRERAQEDQKALQAERDRILKQLQLQIERMPVGYIMSDASFQISFLNPAAEHIFGYSRDELTGKSPYGLLIPDPAQAVRENIQHRVVIHGETASFTMECVRKDGSKIVCEWLHTPLTDDGGQVVQILSMVQDITERQTAEQALRQSEERYRMLFDSNPHALWVFDQDTLQFLAVNDAAVHHYGYSRDEFLSMTVKEIQTPEELPSFLARIDRVKEGMDVLGMWQHRKKDGSVIDVEIIAHSVNFAGRRGELVLAWDITDRKRADEQIKASLKEKEVLLKEIHHRVKNNMQVISSLLNLQAGYIKDSEDLALFKESQNRVRSMALIHEKLYRSASLSRVDFKEYLHDLATGLFRTYTVRGVTLEVEADEVMLGVDSAIPCGLIVTELVSNALKYAFPEGRRGTIHIGVKAVESGMCQLTVSDNGVGFPAGVDYRHTKSLGLQLVVTLATQLDATIEFHREGGTTFDVVFLPR